MRGRLRLLLLLAIGALYVLSIPWYRTPGDSPGLWLGLPDWVTVALLCYAGVALLNALAWSLTEIRDDEPPRGEP